MPTPFDRREFLTLVGASAAGVSARAGVPWTPPPPGKRVRLAVAGGGFGARHHWHEHPGCDVTAVTDLVDGRRAALAKAYSCGATFGSLEEMLKDAAGTFDAVAVFTDAPSHAKHATLCLEHGKHVVVACPVALTLEDMAALVEVVERTGLTYMMHESSVYRQECIAARELYQAGEFGRLCYSEVEYYHPGIGARANTLSRWQGLKSWRYGFPPMLYPTHSLGLLVGVTGERIVRVSCLGQHVGEDFPANENAYGNPFDNEMALGLTDQGNLCRFGVFWQIAGHGERGQWMGDKLSCYMAGYSGQPQAMAPLRGGSREWEVPRYWETDRLPEAMRHDSGHGGSAAFLSAEFIDALLEERRPSVDLYEAIAMNAPGVVAHESALRGGEQIEVPQFDRR